MKARLLHALDRAGLLRPAYRAYERLLALRGRGGHRPEATDGLPLPPAELIVRVAGTADTAWFLEGGRLAADSIAGALERAGSPLESLERPLLDFGCGCGRVARQWQGRGLDLRGTDLSAEAVAWCAANLDGRFATNGLEPPLDFPDGMFDAAYALSVLTHLPEELGLAWRDELRRILRPGGLLLVSTHGLAYRDRLTDDERERFERGELVVRWESAAGTNLCAVYHPDRYLAGTLAAGFELVEHRPRGATGNPDQDLTVLRKT